MHRSILRKMTLPLLLGLLPVLCCGIYWYTQVRDLPFESQAWLNAPGRSVRSDIRMRMYPDLKARYLVIGMEQSQVRELLGDPDNQSRGYLEYWVDTESIFLTLLWLSFDSDDRLTGYGLGEP